MSEIKDTQPNLPKHRLKYRLFVIFSVFLCVSISWLGVIDRESTEYIDKALVQAGVAFVSAKTLNSLISFLQSIEVSVGFASVAAGEVLSPLHNLIEHYADLMKLSIGSLLIQKILLEIVSDQTFKVLLTISGFFAVASVFFQHVASQVFLLRFFILTLFLRFSLVLMVMANGAVDHIFLNEQTEKQLKISQIKEQEKEKDNKLSAEQRSSLEEEISSLSKENERIATQIDNKLKDKNEIKTEIANIEQKIYDIEKNTPLLDTIFNEDPKITAIKEERDTLEDKLDTVVDEGRELEREQSRIKKEIEFAQLTLEGKSDGFFASVANSFGSVVAGIRDAVSLAKIEAIKEELDSKFNTYINIMALFILKTMIFPLLFLFTITKIFKAIWRVNITNQIISFGNTPIRSI